MASPHLPTFGAQLKRLHRAAQLTQEQLAARAGYLSALERGARKPPPRTVDLLAEMLALDPSTRATLLATTRSHRRPPADHEADHGAERASGVGGRSAAVLGRSGSSAPPPLVGRASELARLQRQLQGAEPPLLLVTGEPGIGKTRLLHELSGRAQARGWTVLEGGCQRRSGQGPFAPFADALAQSLAARPQKEQHQTLHSCAWLVRLVPELGEGNLVPLPTWTLAPEQERRLMFAAAGHYLANVAGPAGTLLLLDDLQWAGADALDLLTSLVRGAAAVAGSERPLRLLGAYRSTEVDGPHPLTLALADLARDGLAGELALGPLAAEDARRLLAAVWTQDGETAGESDGESGGKAWPGGDLRARVLRRAGGVPFFLVSCAQAVRSDVALAVAAHLGQNRWQALEAAEPCCRAGLLIEQDGQEGSEGGSYGFAHDLIHEVVAADLSAGRLVALHQEIAAALERLSGEPLVEQLADHYARAGNQEQAVVYLERAGDRAWARHANAEAETRYQELVTRLDALGRVLDAARAREQLGDVLIILGRYTEALAVLEQAVRARRTHGDDDGAAYALGRIAFAHARGATAAAWLAQAEPLREVERLAAAARQPSRGLAWLYASLGAAFNNACRSTEQLDAAMRGAHLARAAGEEAALCLATVAQGLALAQLGRGREARAAFAEAAELAEHVGDLVVLARACKGLGALFDAQGDCTAAQPWHERAAETAARLGDPPLDWPGPRHMVRRRVPVR